MAFDENIVFNFSAGLGCKKRRVIQGHLGGVLPYILKQLPQIVSTL